MIVHAVILIGQFFVTIVISFCFVYKKLSGIVGTDCLPTQFKTRAQTNK